MLSVCANSLRDLSRSGGLGSLVPAPAVPRDDCMHTTQFHCKSCSYDLLPRYGDMRKEIGFRIRDMWYNLGESLALNRLLRDWLTFHFLF